MSIRTKLLAASVLLAASIAGQAVAQDGIEVVTVTAAKRAQDVQDVPISMNVVGGEQMQKFQVLGMKDLETSIPGLYIVRTPGDQGIWLRGFGVNPGNPFADQTVSTYLDGIYQGYVRQTMIPYFDIQRVEVLRGPQGTLLGKNTSAGAISFVTASPTDTLEGSFTTGYNFDRPGTDTYGYISGPITDTLSARVAVKYTNLDGYVRNQFTGKDDPRIDDKAVRLSLQFKPSEDLTVLTKYMYAMTNQTGRPEVNCMPFTMPISTCMKSYYANGKAGAAINGFAGGPGGAFATQLTHFLSNEITWGFGDGYTLVALTGYNAIHSKTNGFGSEINRVNDLSTYFASDITQGSQELRVLSPEDQAVSWIIGAYVDYSHFHMRNIPTYDVYFGAPGVATRYVGQTEINTDMNTYTYSAYATATWHILDNLNLLGSARWTQNNKNASFRTQINSGVALLGAGPRATSGKINEDHFDPGITIQYEPIEDIKLYASWSRGSTSGGFDGANRSLVLAGFTNKAETSTNYELGAKTQLWGFLQMDIALYIMDFKNLQVTAYDPVLLTNTTRNAAAATSQGVELTFGADLNEWIPGFSISGSGAYMDAFYTNYPGATCVNALSPYFYAGCAGPTNNLKGLPLVAASKWSGNFRMNYTQPIGDRFKLTLNTQTNMRSPQWLDSTYTPGQSRLFGYAKWDVRVELGDQEDRWSIALIGKNLTNVLTSAQSYAWPFEGTLATGTLTSAGQQIDDPRSFAIEGTIRF